MSRVFGIASLGLILCLLTQPVLAGETADVSDALVAFNQHNYSKSLKLVRPLADHNSGAQFLLGAMYLRGWGVPKNAPEAAKWYKLSATQGHPMAQVELGLIYLNGNSLPQDYDQALKFFQLAANQDYAQAQYNLGAMYFQGQGVPQDFVRAHMWVNLACSNYLPAEADLRNESVKFRDEISVLMPSAQLAEAQKMASEWVTAHPHQ